MESNFQTSFIPKKPITDGATRPVHTTSLFSILSTVLFITVLLIAGGFFGYQYYLNSSIEKTKANLQTELSRFEPSLVAQLTHLDTQIESSKTLLNNHLALSGFFDFLGAHTLRTVRFTSFSYASTPTGLAVVMTGQGQTYAAIASQAQEFSKSENQQYITNTSFSGLNPDKSGNINFTFSGTIVPNAFNYKKSLTAADLSAPVIIPVATSTATTTASTTKKTTTSH